MKHLWLILLAAPLFAQNPKPCTSVVNSATAGQVLSANSNGSSPQCKWITGGGGGGSGTVTSVGLSLPSSTFTISGSPVTTSGTLTGTYKNQTANTVFSGPASGPAAAPTFRGLVAADLPAGTGTVTSVGSADASVVVTNPTTTPDLSVRKINGVAYPATPSNNTVPVVTSSNTITYEAVPNAALANAATTVNSQTCTLGSTCTVTAAPSGTAGGDLSGSYPNPGVAKINGTSFAGTNGHVVSFGASNTPADSGIVGANVLTGTATNHGVAIGGAAQALSFTSAGTSGNCLLSNGASADPTFQACPGGGLTVGTTTITSGTNTKVLFDNSGVLGEYTISGTGNVCMSSGSACSPPSITQGTYASLPGTCTTGDLYYPTDSPYQVARCSATNTWTNFLAGYGSVTRPVATGGTWVNQGSSTIDNTNGPVFITSPADASDSIKAYLNTAIPGATWTSTSVITPSMVGTNYSNVGMCFAESTSSGTKLYALMAFWDQNNAGADMFISLQKATNATTPGAAVNTIFVPLPQDTFILKAQVDSTNITFSIILGNRNTFQIFQEAKTTFMATGVNNFGPCVNPRNSTYPAAQWVMSMVSTTP